MYVICYDTEEDDTLELGDIEIKYLDNWYRDEDYLYEVYEKNGHTGYYIKEIDKQ